MTGQEIRVTVPGHMQRGGTPVPYDRVLSTRIGAHAADMIKNNEFGKLVVVKNNVITDIPLAESAGKLKYVDPQSDIVKERSLSESVSETDRTCHIKRYTGNGVRRSLRM